MIDLRWLLPAAFGLMLSPGLSAASGPLDRDALEMLLSGNTTACRKEKDQSLCTNFFGADGYFKRHMHDDGAERIGRWFIDDTDRLCILWDGRIKALCFAVLENADGTYDLIRNEKHISSILEVIEGNPEGL